MKYVLAISGGIDSSVLLNACAQHRLAELTGSPLPETAGMIVAHFNHGTAHGKKAEEVVQKLAKKYDLPFQLGSTKQKLASEADFRTARYSWLGKMAQRLGCERIVTAHHADDQAETVLFNLVRGSGLAGLGGMSELNGQIWRPFLRVPKKDIANYAKKYKLTWLDDPTNTNPKYARNRLRINILPELAKINPQITKALLRTARQAGEADVFIQKKAVNWLQRNADRQQIELAKFVKTEPVLARAVLREIHKKEIGHTQQLEEVHVAEIYELAAAGLGNKHKKFGELVFKTTRNTTKKRVLIWYKTS